MEGSCVLLGTKNLVGRRKKNSFFFLLKCPPFFWLTQISQLYLLLLLQCTYCRAVVLNLLRRPHHFWVENQVLDSSFQCFLLVPEIRCYKSKKKHYTFQQSNSRILVGYSSIREVNSNLLQSMSKFFSLAANAALTFVFFLGGGGNESEEASTLKAPSSRSKSSFSLLVFTGNGRQDNTLW